MNRVSLEQMLAQGLSLAEIGRRFGRHEATVSYWLKQYGLEAANRDRHVAKGGLTREELASLVDAGMSITEIAEAVGRSKATVRHWLGKHGLRTAGGAGRRSSEVSREAREAGLEQATLVLSRPWTDQSCPRQPGLLPLSSVPSGGCGAASSPGKGDSG